MVELLVLVQLLLLLLIQIKADGDDSFVQCRLLPEVHQQRGPGVPIWIRGNIHQIVFIQSTTIIPTVLLGTVVLVK